VLPLTLAPPSLLPAADGGDKLAAWKEKNKAKINANKVKRAKLGVPENAALAHVVDTNAEGAAAAPEPPQPTRWTA
jgi:hypothetical protein